VLIDDLSGHTVERIIKKIDDYGKLYPQYEKLSKSTDVDE